jgi:hypothetical protein
MNKKITHITSVFIVIALVIALVIGVLVIWNALDSMTAKDTGLKVLYTLGGMYILSVLVTLFTHKPTNEK